MTYAGVCRNLRTDTPGPEGSMLKLYYAEVAKEVGRLAMDVLGPDALRFVSRWVPRGGWTGNYFYSFSQSIGGGTSEVQRNIIGEQLLGLPKEPRLDAGPFRELSGSRS